MSQNTQIFVVDPDPATLAQVRSVTNSLRRAGTACSSEEIGWWPSAEHFFADLPAGSQGLVVSELVLPGMDGLRLQDRLPGSLQLLFLTAGARIAMVVDALRQGAVTVLEKPASDESLRLAMSAALAAESLRRPSIAVSGTTEVESPNFTRREREVLRLILAGKPNKAIARRLQLGLRTVESCRQQVFRKTGSRSLADLVRVAVAAELAGRSMVVDEAGTGGNCGAWQSPLSETWRATALQGCVPGGVR